MSDKSIHFPKYVLYRNKVKVTIDILTIVSLHIVVVEEGKAVGAANTSSNITTKL